MIPDESNIEDAKWDEYINPRTYNDPHNPYRQINNYDPYNYLYPKGMNNAGYRKIETPLLKLLKTGFLGDNEMRIFLYIFDLTRGWAEKSAVAAKQSREGYEYKSTTQLCKDCMEECDLASRDAFHKNFKRLIKKQVLYLWEVNNRKLVSINFNITTWKAAGENTNRDKAAGEKLDKALSCISTDIQSA